jgi:molybdopterin converting factor small subunit
MPVVCVRGPLRRLAGGEGEHDVEGVTVLEVLGALEERHPSLAGWILDERRAIRRHINVFVNGDQALAVSPVEDEDRIDIVPAITGG